MVAGLLILVLAAGGPETTFDRDAAQAELSAVAVRIEQLKARYASGDGTVVPELHLLLVRAQELAHAIEATSVRPPPSDDAPTAEELRERADADRDEADRLRRAIERIDTRMIELQLGPRAPEASLASAAPAGAPEVPAAERLAMLEAQRNGLLHRLAIALAEAEHLEAEARKIEQAK
jgi:hypothetical protein